MRTLSNRGQALIEYILIVSLISVITIGAVKLFGGYLKDSLTKSACTLTNQKYIEGNKPGDGYCKYTLD